MCSLEVSGELAKNEMLSCISSTMSLSWSCFLHLQKRKQFEMAVPAETPALIISLETAGVGRLYLFRLSSMSSGLLSKESVLLRWLLERSPLLCEVFISRPLVTWLASFSSSSSIRVRLPSFYIWLLSFGYSFKNSSAAPSSTKSSWFEWFPSCKILLASSRPCSCSI